MVIVAFQLGEKYAVNYTTLDQYDYGQVLRIQGLKLPKTVEVHFSTQETGGTSLTRVGVTKDGVTDVLIPDSVLENGDTTQNYSIFAFVYITDATSGKTEYRARLEVKARPKPEVPGGGDNPDIFHEAVLEVRKSAEKAEEAQKQAEGWAHGREDLPERAEDNAKYYAGKASEDVQRTAEDRKEVERLTESNVQMQGEVEKDLEEVKKLSSQAQTSAANATLSEQKSKEAATRAETAQAGAETAEGNAELAAQKTGQDKTAVEQAKKLVQQMGQEVLDNKNAVDKTAQDFALKAQQALADVNNAGQTQTGRVQSAGTTAVENIKTAQNTATRAVETAKSEAIKAVQTEGTTQTGTVTAEGEKQVQAVQTAAQEIIADREKIQKNTTDIADLRQKKADAIVESVSGTLLNVKDSSGAFFEDFSMSGKTTQDGTPTPDAPVEIVNAGQDGTIEIKVTGKNLLPNTRIPDKTENGITMKYKADGVYHFSGTSTNRFDSYTLNLSDISFLPGKYRFLTGKNVKSQIVVTQKNTGQDIWYGYEFTINKGDKLKYWYCTVASGKIVDEDIYVYMERDTGNTLTVKDFEPPREPQTITLSSDRPLAKWDRLEKREGVWGIARNGDRKILDGTETWYRYTLYENDRLYCYCAEGIKSEIGYQKSYCTHFKNENSVWLSQKGKYGEYSDHETLPNKYFISDKPTVEEFKAWLTQQEEAGTPVELVYKTAEETWEPLPEEMQSVLNALHTNYPTTVVSNSEDTEMELSYIADTKNYYLSREQTIQKQILEIQNALISQKISGGGIKVTNSAKLPIVKLSVFGKSEQVTTTGKNLWGFGDISFKGYKELSVNYPAGNYVLSFGIETEASSNTAQTGICIDGIWKYYQVKKDNRAAIKISSATGITAVRFYAGDSPAVKDNAEYYNIQIEKGADATDYEPYTGGKPSPSTEYPQEITSCGENGTINLEIAGDNAEPQTLIIPTPNGLLGLKVEENGNYTDENGQQWITDEIDLARGKYVQRIRKIILDGNIDTKHVGQHENGTKYLGIILQEKDYTLKASNMLCTRYIRAEWTNKNGYVYSTKKDAVFITDNRFTDLETTKKIIGEEKPVIIYPLLTPIETDLPPETIAAFKQLHTNYPNTIVSNNADAGMELTYTVDTQSYVDSKIAEVSTAIVQKGI